jgi:hypothetical protein
MYHVLFMNKAHMAHGIFKVWKNLYYGLYGLVKFLFVSLFEVNLQIILVNAFPNHHVMFF